MSGALVLSAPLDGWSTDLSEAPDEVFAARMLGDGLAIDPTSDTLLAPCDGEVVQLAPAHHALTLRAAGGCDIVLHVGIDTVALQGAGFMPRTSLNARVRAGEPLLSFDLDLLARRAKSVLTPLLVTSDSPFEISQRTLGRAVRAGEPVLELLPRASASTAGARTPRDPLRREVRVRLAHGIHARPAALIAAALRPLAADVRLRAGEHTGNARSPVTLMGLGVAHGARVELTASGPDAPTALDLLEKILGEDGSRAASAPLVAGVPARAGPRAPGEFTGVVAAPGLALGPLVRLQREEIAVAEHGAGAEEEARALEQARAGVRGRLERAAASGGSAAPAREIASAHLALLEDPELLADARRHIDAGRSAAFAWRSALREAARRLAGLTDPRQRERAEDLLDLETQVLHALQGGGAATPAPALPERAILLARELLPSQLLALEGARVAGIALAGGGATSHVAILAAAMGIPTVVALGPEVLQSPEGAQAVLDAGRGVLETRPAAARVAAVRAEVEARQARREAARQAAQGEARTADGTRILVLANVGSVAEARAAVANGAEGCGLLRTEFLFMERREAPEEAEQTAAYRAIAAAFAGRPVTLRTLDAGGDKPLAYLALPPEENPALGLRGVRTSLAYPELLRTQLRAVLAARAPGLRLLLPMISDVAELRAVRALLQELSPPGAPVLPVGVMVETPAAALLAESLAGEADFLSIGTNDLTQYTLAMDRGHALLAARADALHPAVLSLIARTAAGAHAHRRHAAVCGGLASEPAAAALLVGLGIDELSAVPAAVPAVKDRLRAVSLLECRALAERALRLGSAGEVRRLLSLPAAAGT